MHPENAIDNGDFIKILVYKFILLSYLLPVKTLISSSFFFLPYELELCFLEARPVDLLHGSIVSAVISIVNVIALRFLDFGEINNTNFYLYRKIRTNSNLYVIIFTITVVFL